MIIGGDRGTAGAIRMTGEAALRTGAGLVRVPTRSENITPIVTARPELMVHELTPKSLDDSLQWADVVVIGPGLGQESWGRRRYARSKTSGMRCCGTLTRSTFWQSTRINVTIAS